MHNMCKDGRIRKRDYGPIAGKWDRRESGGSVLCTSSWKASALGPARA
jgi:hypothetical protein